MKKILIILFPVFLVIAGCSQEDNISGPDLSVAPQNVTWIDFSEQVDVVSFQKHVFVNKIIEGKKGGDLKLDFRVNLNNGGELEVKAKLKVDKDSFSPDSLLDISMLLDDETTTSTFGPSPYNFQQPLKLDLTYKGLDLTGINPDDIDFYYMAADGQLVKAVYKKLEVKIDEGKIKVDDALLPHFSRYGFTKTR